MNFWFVAIPVAIIVVGLVYYIYRESTGFCVTSYELYNQNISCDRVRIVLLSDLHDRMYGPDNEKLLQAIESISPDFICFAGDMVNSGGEFKQDYSHTLCFIAKLSERYPIYYGLGNHENKFNRLRDKFPTQFEDLKSFCKEHSVSLLENDSVYLETYGIRLYGLNLDHTYFRKFKTKHLPDGALCNLLGERDISNYTILLAHNPEHFKSYVKWNADLVLSGHVHGGIIRLPGIGGVISPGIKLFPKYDHGIFKEAGSTMVLSAGIGTHTIPIRINNKAEIVSITINKGAANES